MNDKIVPEGDEIERLRSEADASWRAASEAHRANERLRRAMKEARDLLLHAEGGAEDVLADALAAPVPVPEGDYREYVSAYGDLTLRVWLDGTVEVFNDEDAVDRWEDVTALSPVLEEPEGEEACCDAAALKALKDEVAKENCGLRGALSVVLAATDPYVEDAAPGEQMDGVWCRRFEALTSARRQAFDALSGGVPAPVPVPEGDGELIEASRKAASWIDMLAAHLDPSLPDVHRDDVARHLAEAREAASRVYDLCADRAPSPVLEEPEGDGLEDECARVVDNQVRFETARLRGALRRVMDELGVLGGFCPTPVANAYSIAREALATSPSAPSPVLEELDRLAEKVRGLSDDLLKLEKNWTDPNDR